MIIDIGLIIGRFQPLHKGHISAISQALKKVNFLHIGIGSSQYSNKKRNPFSFEERKEMIKRALKEEGIDKKRYKITAIPDIHDNKKWPKYVHTLIPNFQVVFISKDEIVKELFEEYDITPVEKLNIEIDICASKIRNAIKKGKNYKELLPNAVIDYLKEIDGIKRIKEVS